jgi:hypothetical protein
MTRKSYLERQNEKRVKADEADAEKRYQSALAVAAAAALAMANDKDRPEADRIANAQAATALEKVEEARVVAAVAEPPLAKRTFLQTVRDWIDKTD